MTTNNLYRLAEKKGVTVDRFTLTENGSIAIKHGDKMFVGLGRC